MKTTKEIKEYRIDCMECQQLEGCKSASRKMAYEKTGIVTYCRLVIEPPKAKAKAKIRRNHSGF